MTEVQSPVKGIIGDRKEEEIQRRSHGYFHGDDVFGLLMSHDRCHMVEGAVGVPLGDKQVDLAGRRGRQERCRLLPEGRAGAARVPRPPRRRGVLRIAADGTLLLAGLHTRASRRMLHYATCCDMLPAIVTPWSRKPLACPWRSG